MRGLGGGRGLYGYTIMIIVVHRHRQRGVSAWLQAGGGVGRISRAFLNGHQALWAFFFVIPCLSCLKSRAMCLRKDVILKRAHCRRTRRDHDQRDRWSLECLDLGCHDITHIALSWSDLGFVLLVFYGPCIPIPYHCPLQEQTKYKTYAINETAFHLAPADLVET